MGRIKYTKDLERKVKDLKRDNRDLRKLNKDYLSKRDEYWDKVLSLREKITGLESELYASAIEKEELKQDIRLFEKLLESRDRIIKHLRDVNSSFFKSFNDLKWAYLHFRDENFKLKDDLIDLNKKVNELECEIDGTPYASDNSDI